MKPKTRTTDLDRIKVQPMPATPALPATSRRDLRVAQRIGQAFGVLPPPPKTPQA